MTFLILLLGLVVSACVLGAADALAGVDLPLTKVDQEFTVATVPDATKYKGRLIYVSNGNAGAACIARSDGTNWKVSGGATTIAAS